MENLQKGFCFEQKLSHENVAENYSSIAFKKMNIFRERGQLCDVVIKVEGQQYSAHRVILAASSDYFEAMFSSGMTESAQLEVELKSISPIVMEALLEYVYTGQVHVNMDIVQDLLPAANLVQMEGVRNACSSFLLGEVDVTNVLGIRRFADLHNCLELELFARNYAVNKFKLVVEFEEFIYLTHEELLNLIRREDLHIDNEESVYKAVMRWVYHQPIERVPHLSTLLRNIRLPVMSVRFITDIVDKDPLIRQSLVCRDMVDDAKRYYLRPDLRHEMLDLRYRYRDRRDEYLVVMGGFDVDRNPSLSVEMFNPRTLEWTELLDLPISHRYVAACSIDTCVYVIGGFDGSDRLNTVYSLDLAQRDEGWRWLSQMHYKRSLSAACTNRGLIYVCGGYDGESRLCSLEVYHPKIDEWRIMEEMTTAREGAGLIVVDDILYSLAGYDGFHLLNSIEALDLRGGSWLECKPMHMKRSGAGCASLGETIYVCGGYGGAEGQNPLQLDTVETYNTRLAQWSLVANMNVPRCYVGACPMSGKIYVVAGYNGSNLLDSVESYDPIENIWKHLDESCMNYKRCDTGMCVVRLMLCSVSSTSNLPCPGTISRDSMHSSISVTGSNTLTTPIHSSPLNLRIWSDWNRNRRPNLLVGRNTDLVHSSTATNQTNLPFLMNACNNFSVSTTGVNVYPIRTSSSQILSPSNTLVTSVSSVLSTNVSTSSAFGLETLDHNNTLFPRSVPSTCRTTSDNRGAYLIKRNFRGNGQQLSSFQTINRKPNLSSSFANRDYYAFGYLQNYQTQLLSSNTCPGNVDDRSNVVPNRLEFSRTNSSATLLPTVSNENIDLSSERTFFAIPHCIPETCTGFESTRSISDQDNSVDEDDVDDHYHHHYNDNVDSELRCDNIDLSIPDGDNHPCLFKTKLGTSHTKNNLHCVNERQSSHSSLSITPVCLRRPISECKNNKSPLINPFEVVVNRELHRSADALNFLIRDKFESWSKSNCSSFSFVTDRQLSNSFVNQVRGEIANSIEHLANNSNFELGTESFHCPYIFDGVNPVLSKSAESLYSPDSTSKPSMFELRKLLESKALIKNQSLNLRHKSDHTLIPSGLNSSKISSLMDEFSVNCRIHPNASGDIVSSACTSDSCNYYNANNYLPKSEVAKSFLVSHFCQMFFVFI